MKRILVLNAGSSSIKFGLYSVSKDALMLKGEIERLGTNDASISTDQFFAAKHGLTEVSEREPVRARDAREGVRAILDFILRSKGLKSLRHLAGVGHRVVHGGEAFSEAVLVDEEVAYRIEELSTLAPLHNPANLSGIEAVQHVLRGVPNVAVFDTAFYQSLAPEVYLYGLPRKYYDEHGIRKYGFHGTSHKYCMLEAERLLGGMPSRLVTCHLGNGSSITAIKDGVAVDTSMGFTPLDGLLMGTRSGALDPGVVLQLMRLGLNVEEADRVLNNESGFKALAGRTDMRDIHAAAEHGDAQAQLVIAMLALQLQRFIGSYAGILGGLDALVFTGGIGCGAWYLRERVASTLAHLGVSLDVEANRRGLERVSSGRVAVLVIPTNEELQIARETRELLF
ncbi:acetate kinase [Candidatus Woesearchaeota archaeon]|nr:MAG: acetate kinase [Candidatus Woesearchaeota archaeon]